MGRRQIGARVLLEQCDQLLAPPLVHVEVAVRRRHAGVIELRADVENAAAPLMGQRGEAAPDIVEPEMVP